MPNRSEEIRGDFLEMLESRITKWLDSLADDILEDIRTEADINRYDDPDYLLQDAIELIAQKLCNTGTARHKESWLLYVVDKYVDILAPVWGNLDHAHNQHQNVVVIYVDGPYEVVRKPDHIVVSVTDLRLRRVEQKLVEEGKLVPALGIKFGYPEPEQLVRPATIEEITHWLRNIEDRELVREID